MTLRGREALPPHSLWPRKALTSGRVLPIIPHMQHVNTSSWRWTRPGAAGARAARPTSRRTFVAGRCKVHDVPLAA
jgi:hypothetical protein